ncbi:MAG: hypothetical protein FWG89_05025 [Treponema sp.]|nr:hypothetical protein [Treponema sp.]
MTIEQIVEIPADYRIFLDLPHSVPVGAKARIAIDIPVDNIIDQDKSVKSPSAEIKNIRQLLNKEMTENGTLAVTAASGDGWEAHARERYAEP